MTNLYSYRIQKFWFIAAFALLGMLESYASADVIEHEVYVATCRRNGVNVQIAIPVVNLPDFSAVGHTVDYGRYTEYTFDDGKIAPCQKTPGVVERYNYSKLSIATPWKSKFNVPFGHDQVTALTPGWYTEADNLAYWDWYYDEYESPGVLDYSQNCHGYAFGVGDCPDNAGGFVGHGWYPGTTFEFELCLASVILTSSEQFLESGTYTRTVVPTPPLQHQCPDSLDITLAHGYFETQLNPFKLYKMYLSCYLRCKTKDATIATNVSGHTIKVSCGQCAIQSVECQTIGHGL